MYRKIVRVTCIDIGPYIGSEEKSLVEEDSVVARFRIWSRSFCMEMMEMKVSHFAVVRPSAQCLDKYVRYAGYTAQVYVVTCLDCFYSFVSRNINRVFHSIAAICVNTLQ